jgi:hypothetical protein
VLGLLGCHIGQYQAWRLVMPAHVTDHAAMKNTQEPPFGTPEYEMLGLERIVSTAGESHEGVSAFLTATVTFAGDGDMVQEAEVFQRAADYFKAHPELRVTAANWTTFTDDDEGERYALVLSVVPPAWLNPDDVRRIYPKAKQ